MTRKTRMVLGFAVALVVVGGVLIYVGTRGHGRSGFEEHPPGGFAVGKLHVVGGPKQRNGSMLDGPLPGTVTAHHSGNPGPSYEAPIGADGLFRMQLPPGDYVLGARPTNVGIEAPDSQVVTIRDRQTAHVDFVILVT
jgi:hypothetical protein